MSFLNDLADGFTGLGNDAADIVKAGTESALPWYAQMGINLGNQFLGGAAGAAGQNLGSQLFAPNPAEVDPEQLRLGYNEERRSWRKMQRFEWQQAQKRGLTAQEFYGSPVPGGSPGGSGAQTLGNAASQGEIAAQGRSAAAFNAGADRALQMSQQQTQLEVAKIGAEAQMYSADAAAGAHTYGTDVQAQTAANRLELDTEIYESVTKPQAQKILRLTEAQIDHELNLVATTDPKYVRSMKIMTMSADNLVATAMVNGLEVDLFDTEAMLKLDPERRKAMLTGLIAMNSHLFREVEGMKMSFDDWLNAWFDIQTKQAADNAFLDDPMNWSEDKMKAWIKQRNDSTLQKYDDPYSSTGKTSESLGNPGYRKLIPRNVHTIGVEG